MNQIDASENIASDEEVNNVDAEPLHTDSGHNELDLIALDLDDPKSDPNDRIKFANIICHFFWQVGILGRFFYLVVRGLSNIQIEFVFNNSLYNKDNSHLNKNL